jgi:hypothetical protein
MRPSLLRSSEPEGHCSRLWLISLNRDAGFARASERQGSKSHCRRSALRPHAGGVISNAHARIGSTGGANLLRARGALVSFSQSSPAPVFRTDGSVGKFPRHRENECSDADCQAMNDMHALAQALLWAMILGHLEGNPAEMARLASDLIELSTRQFWLPARGDSPRLGTQRFRSQPLKLRCHIVGTWS